MRYQPDDIGKFCDGRETSEIIGEAILHIADDLDHAVRIWAGDENREDEVIMTACNWISCRNLIIKDEFPLYWGLEAFTQEDVGLEFVD